MSSGQFWSVAGWYGPMGVSIQLNHGHQCANEIFSTAY